MTDVLVVDDSQFMRTVLSTVLREHGFDVRTASDGESAVEATLEHDPDVITMDVRMPGVDGIEAVERIMAERPTPICMLSAYTREGADASLAALSRGAVEVLPKPGGEVSADVGAIEDDLVETVAGLREADLGSQAWERAASAARTAADAERAVQAAGDSARSRAGDGPVPAGDAGTDRELRADGAAPAVDPGAGVDPRVGVDAEAGTDAVPAGDGDATPDSATEGLWTTDDGEIPGRTGSQPNATPVAVPPGLDVTPTVVIGASTGGPQVLEHLLAALPVDLDARVLVVQHMPASFTDRLARRLDGVTEYDVREAADGARIADGEVVVAKGDYHVAVTYHGDEHLRVRLREDEPLHGCRPAIDVTMETAAETVDGPLVAVALTGMGQDGAAGISAIADAGGATVAQDRASAPVYGIPKHAAATGDVDRICSTDELAGAIVDAVEELAADREGGEHQ